MMMIKMISIPNCQSRKIKENGSICTLDTLQENELHLPMLSTQIEKIASNSMISNTLFPTSSGSIWELMESINHSKEECSIGIYTLVMVHSQSNQNHSLNYGHMNHNHKPLIKCYQFY